jgi:hypothetical protein
MAGTSCGLAIESRPEKTSGSSLSNLPLDLYSCRRCRPSFAISKDLLNEISRAIGKYMTPLIYKEKLVGSATFITVDNIYGLLPAYHVADLVHFFRPGKLGINLVEHLTGLKSTFRI